MGCATGVRPGRDGWIEPRSVSCALNRSAGRNASNLTTSQCEVARRLLCGPTPRQSTNKLERAKRSRCVAVLLLLLAVRHARYHFTIGFLTCCSAIRCLQCLLQYPQPAACPPQPGVGCLPSTSCHPQLAFSGYPSWSLQPCGARFWLPFPPIGRSHVVHMSDCLNHHPHAHTGPKLTGFVE